jgi:hypothetical protein
LPPRQAPLVEPDDFQDGGPVHIQDGGHVLSWVVSTHEGLVLFYQFTQTPQSVFEGALTTVEEKAFIL